MGVKEVTGDLHKALFVYERINYQFKTSELKNAEKVVEQSLKSCWNGLGMCMFVKSMILQSFLVDSP